jgi:hypothetical protein
MARASRGRRCSFPARFWQASTSHRILIGTAAIRTRHKPLVFSSMTFSNRRLLPPGRCTGRRESGSSQGQILIATLAIRIPRKPLQMKSFQNPNRNVSSILHHPSQRPILDRLSTQFKRATAFLIGPAVIRTCPPMTGSATVRPVRSGTYDFFNRHPVIRISPKSFTFSINSRSNRREIHAPQCTVSLAYEKEASSYRRRRASFAATNCAGKIPGLRGVRPAAA